MKIFAGVCLLLAATLPARGEIAINAGSWKVTTTTMTNGMTPPPRVNNRCLTPEQAADVSKTFSPEFGGVNSTCERTEFETKDKVLRWRLQCKGQFDMDVAAEFTFESSIRYTAKITTKGTMGGQPMVNSSQSIVGEYDGECH